MIDVIEQLLVETDLVDDIPLREFLVELQDTARAVRPMPSAELVALLVAGRAVNPRHPTAEVLRSPSRWRGSGQWAVVCQTGA